ncbi:MAG: peptidylprolyl isomerase, partial [Gammaproteobacteria bacterium]|nr:peptidylprolyl isomerase [Gammaproteobacteria bacterium]
ILIMDDDDAKAKQEADAVLARVNAGESFEELAKELSKDPGSASQGGDLGFFGLGLMDKAFEDAAYQLQIGEVSPVIKSEFGYHIIKLEEIRGGVTKSFAEVKDQILAEIQQEHAEKGFYDQAELLANYTYEQPDTLQVAAEQLNLSIQQTPLFGRNGGTGIAKNQKFYQAAFSEDVLQRGNNSEVIELSKTHFVVLRLDEHQPEATQPLDSVRGVIEKQLLKDKAEEGAQLYAKSLIDNISAGEKAEALAKSEKLSWSANTITRDSKDVDRAIVSASFKMSHPQSGELTKELVKLANGDQVIVVLNAIISPDSEKAKVDEKDEKTLRKGYASASYSAIVNQLRNSSDITVNR